MRKILRLGGECKGIWDNEGTRGKRNGGSAQCGVENCVSKRVERAISGRGERR